MSNRIKETFDQIHAERELVDGTREYLARKTSRYSGRRVLPYRRLVPVMACLSFVLVCLAAYGLYFVPTSMISIDVNPSLELGINRFGKVVSIEPYNDDGERLVKDLSIRFMDYRTALKQILDNEDVSELLSGDEVLSVVVVVDDEKDSEKIISDVTTCISGYKNAHCYSADNGDAMEAHEMGVSCGKYKAFLELQALDPDVTAEEVKGMTMRELWDRIAELSQDSSGISRGGDYAGNGENHGHGHGHDMGDGCGEK